MTRERSHDFCHDQTRPLTTPEDEKLVEQENRKRKAAAKACQSLDTRVSKVPLVKSHQTLTMTVQSARTAQLKPRLQIYLSYKLQFYSEIQKVNHNYFRNVHQSCSHYYALRFSRYSSI